MSRPPAAVAEKTGKGVQTAALVIIASAAVIAAMSAASAVFAPVAFALFGIALLWPVQERLQRVLPRALALVACVVLLAAIFVVFGSLIAWAFGRVGRWAMTETSRFQALYDGAVLWLEGHGVAVTGVWTEHFNARWVFTAVQTLASRANSTLTFWVVVFVYVILGLLEVDNFRRRAAALSNPALRHLLLGGTRETALKLRRYMVVRTQMSLLTGVLVGGLAWLVGLDLAVEWGVIAFTLNYVPFIGPLVTTVFPTALALVQFSSWQSAALLFVALNAIQSVVGTYIEPRVSGSALSISPPLVLFAVFFWAFLWGLLGAVIGVPIAIALVTFCSQHPTSRWLADLFSTSGRDV